MNEKNNNIDNIDNLMDIDIKDKIKEENNEYEEINIDKMNLEQLLSGIPNNIFEEIKKNVNDNIPKDIDELFKHRINWEIITKYELKRIKIKKHIEEGLLKYFDQVDAFSKFILEKLGVLSPYELQNKLKYVLEENAEVSIYLI